MPSKQSAALVSFYNTTKNATKDQELPFDVYRALLEELHTLSSEPTNVIYEDVQCPGTNRPAIWCKPLSVSKQHAILYCHGGGFFAGSPSCYRKLAGHLAKAVGVYVLVIDYRRAPEFQYPAQLDDSTAAWRWLLGQGFKAEHMAVAGDSAGGNLAITTMLKIKQSGGELPGAVVGFSPWVDMQLLSPSFDTNADKDAIISRQQSAHGVAMWLGKGSPKDPLVNPLHGDFAGCPPIYLSVGDDEVLRDDSVRLADVAKAAGVDVKLVVEEGMQHVYVFMAGKAPEADDELKSVGAWLRPRLGLEE